MRLKERHEDGVTIFALSGAIDLHYVPTLRSLFQSKLNERCPALIVDLSAVDFIDSSGLATLIEYHRDAGTHGGIFSLAEINPNLKAIFDVVQFDKVLAIFPTVAEAKAAIKRGQVQPYLADKPGAS
jgi:anti-sigma B factor antagonist